MITAVQISKSLYGAWRLARFDAGGLQYFDNTVEEFWRSFYAAAIVAPMITILVVIHLAEMKVGAGPVRIFLVEAVTYALDWLIFPFIALYIADFIGKGDRYLRYIAARNWAVVLQMALFLFISLLSQAGVLGTGPAITFSVAATIAILIYQGFITRVALDVSIRASAAIVFLDLIIGIMLNVTTNRMIQ
jgi:hypothetical protein